ncbi:cell division protein FtsL [Derxia gummosa]|uniref:Cell division protein FtsL n=1 Tax=Derxia gummosa DSM 723 TaxID=1121388 RepID=A0A8B6X1N0_9BURK|nr:cell division protein FtsL [Derxia gummosa]
MILRVILIVAVMASAFSMITAQQRMRRAMGETYRLQNEERALNLEWSQLQLDQTTYGKHSLIDASARQFGMRTVTPERTQFLSPGELGGGAK